jgi:hypothetical protein
MRVFALGGNAFFRIIDYDMITEGSAYNLKTSVRPLAVFTLGLTASRFITDLAARRREFENRLWLNFVISAMSTAGRLYPRQLPWKQTWSSVEKCQLLP